MEVLYERCCGLDVHKRTVVGCLLTPGPKGERRQETRTFGTMTDDLLALADWLAGAGCTHVAMEATGAYWKPVYNILESHLRVILANAQQVKSLPGRKTDRKDGRRLAQPYMADTVNVAPGERYDVLVTASEPGVWALHCHILSHAESPQGMHVMVTAVIVQK